MAPSPPSPTHCCRAFVSSSSLDLPNWYNVPRSFLTRTGNLLVLLDEEYGNPLDISIGTVSTTKVCGHVYEEYPGRIKPKLLQLHCPRKKKFPRLFLQALEPLQVIVEVMLSGVVTPLILEPLWRRVRRQIIE